MPLHRRQALQVGLHLKQHVSMGKHSQQSVGLKFALRALARSRLLAKMVLYGFVAFAVELANAGKPANRRIT